MMKRILILLVILLITDRAFTQKQDSITAIADSSAKILTWEIQKFENRTLMLLDVPYQRDNYNSTEYISLTVAKDSSEMRPLFISIIIPNDVIQSNGIFIKFANTIKTKEGETKIEPEKSNPEIIPIESCDEVTCTTKIIAGYLTNEKTRSKIDIFQKFIDFDNAVFLLEYPDGSHKSVVIPLLTFKEKYKTL